MWDFEVEAECHRSRPAGRVGTARTIVGGAGRSRSEGLRPLGWTGRSGKAQHLLSVDGLDVGGRLEAGPRGLEGGVELVGLPGALDRRAVEGEAGAGVARAIRQAVQPLGEGAVEDLALAGAEGLVFVHRPVDRQRLVEVAQEEALELRVVERIEDRLGCPGQGGPLPLEAAAGERAPVPGEAPHLHIQNFGVTFPQADLEVVTERVKTARTSSLAWLKGVWSPEAEAAAKRGRVHFNWAGVTVEEARDAVGAFEIRHAVLAIEPHEELDDAPTQVVNG